MSSQNQGRHTPRLRMFSTFATICQKVSKTLVPLFVLGTVNGVLAMAQAGHCQSQARDATQTQVSMKKTQDPAQAQRLHQNLVAAKIALAACAKSQALPAPTTTVGQSMFTIGDYTFLFAVDSYGRVLYTLWKLGGAAVGWYEIDGYSVTDAAPAAAAVGDYIFITIKGFDDHLYINQGYPGNWVGWQRW